MISTIGGAQSAARQTNQTAAAPLENLGQVSIGELRCAHRWRPGMGATHDSATCAIRSAKSETSQRAQ
jgi:hypothetical protein